MKAKIHRALAPAWMATLVSGCLNLTPPATPAEAHGLAVEARSSAQVQVNGPRLQMNHGMLELAGSVARRPGSGTPALSHLDILFCDDAGNMLQIKPVRFMPQSIGHSRFANQRGYYSLTLDALPGGTARIIVQAHDANRAVPHGEE